jgi:hypothetical protein
MDGLYNGGWRENKLKGLVIYLHFLYNLYWRYVKLW